MGEPLRPQICDEILLPLLAESRDAEIELRLSHLLQNHARPLITGIVKQKFSSWENVDFDDLESEVIVRLVARLRQFIGNPATYSIWNFRDYVATTTNRVCINYLRSRFPNRCRLKNSLMYLLTRNPSFFLKQDRNGVQICGLSKWQHLDHSVALNSQHLNLEKIRTKLKSGYHNAESLRTALTEIFAGSVAPVELNELLKNMATIFAVQDYPIQNFSKDEANILALISAQGPNPEKTAETCQLLKKMWTEINQLPLKQRAALLLNLKDSDGRDLLSIFRLNGIATFREIARGLELPLEQFAAIWKEIPLGDLRIAELLGVNRQQIINLRKSARERLIRRAGVDHANKNKKSSSLS